MARTKKQLKAKEPVVLRQKPLSKGGYSLYLDIYQSGNRRYEFLKLYLVPEIDEAAKVQNQNTIKVANAIKAKRVIEIANGKAGVTRTDLSKMLLVDWLEEYRASKDGVSTASSIAMLIRHIKIYNKGRAVMLKEVDSEYIKGFISYLANKAVGLYGKNKKEGKRICKHTANNYFIHLSCSLNEAARRKIIASNPAKYLSKEDKKPIKYPQPQRGYLTIEEIKALMNTDASNYQVKQAFLFAVFCGLRISDIRALKWSDLSLEGNQWRASVLMQKTQERLLLPLSGEAMKWLPERGKASANSPVFDNLAKSKTGVSYCVKQWAKKAGIEKNVTFHTSRHTFATTLLTLGADLYTTSKLLGHSKLETTQIYAEIVNQKKVDAVNVLGNAFEVKPETGKEGKE